MKRCRNEVQGKRTGMKWKRMAGTALLGLFCLMTAVGPARAEEPGQQETQQPAAQEIVGNKWYSGTAGDKVYTYKVEASSYFRLVAYQMDNRTTEYLSVKAYCQKPNSDTKIELSDTIEGLVIHPNNGRGETMFYCLPKGTLITIETDAMDGSLAPASTPYKLKIEAKHIRDSYYESESNQKKAKATRVPFEQNVGGIINNNAAQLSGASNAKDVDWYVMTAPKAGNYRVRAVLLKKINQDFNVYYDLTYTVYNKKGKKLLRGATGRGKLKISNSAIKLKKGEKIYVKFEGPSGYNIDGYKYEFKVYASTKK